MDKYRKFFHLILASSLALIVDGIVSQVSFGHIRITSLTILMVLMFFIKAGFGWSSYLLFALIGFLYDAMYLSTIGINGFIFPLLVLIGRKHRGLLHQKVPSFLVLLVFVFLEIGLAYGLSFAYGITRFPFEEVVAYNLFPTLIYQLFIFGVGQLFLDRS